MTDNWFQSLLPDEEWEPFFQALQRHPPRCIRVRPDRAGSIESVFQCDCVPWYADGRIFVDASLRPSQSLHYAAGDYYIQDAGSLLALALLQPKPNEIICDLCAAPGGKASGIVEKLGEEGFLVANEPIASRAPLLRQSLSRTGSLRYAVTTQDPEVLAERLGGMFDAVLVDAPCSGQSMVAKGKRAPNAFDRKQILHSARRQRRILLAAGRLLKPGGRLVYSTCTFAEEENEWQIREMLGAFPNAWQALEPPELSPWKSPLEAGCYRLWPHRHPTSGAFAAGLRLSSSSSFLPPTDRRQRTRANALRPTKDRREKVSTGALSELGKFDRFRVEKDGRESAFGLPNDVPAFLGERLSLDEWPRIGIRGNGYWRPDHALALLDSAWFVPHHRSEIDENAARRYLAGEGLDASVLTPRSLPSESEGGWTVVSWQARPLGWGKCVKGRLKNYLPKAFFQTTLASA